MRLSYIGEIQFLEQFVLPSLRLPKRDINNDCVSIKLSSHETLVWTTDPAPTPVATFLGHNDPEILGWHTAVVNLSDIAANGGTPLGILVSVELPNTTEAEYYMRFNKGLREACKKSGTKLLGGNLKCSHAFSATGTALGIVNGRLLTRIGIMENDKVYVIGEVGNFWAAVLADYYKINVSKSLKRRLNQALCFPKPQTKAGMLIAKMPFHVACMDSSDGIFNCCFQFARMNHINIRLTPDPWLLSQEVEAIYRSANIEPAAGCYSFGDWALVCAVRNIHSRKFERILEAAGIVVTQIGYVKSGPYEVQLDSNGLSINKALLNENFSDGYSHFDNIEDIIAHYLRSPLFCDSNE